MSFWNALYGGNCIPHRDTFGARFACFIGRRRAIRRKNVSVGKTSRISPDAMICAREGDIRIGEGSSIAPGACIQGKVHIGQNCSIQAYTMLVGYPQAGVTIGNDVRIAAHCMMVSANHRFADPDMPIRKQGLDFGPITIEDDVWIGSRVNILAGVTVGRGSVIGAGAVVTKDVPPMSVMVGVPARKIGERGKEK